MRGIPARFKSPTARQGRFAPKEWVRTLCLVFPLFFFAQASADNAKLSSAQRTEIIRAFLAERPFAHCVLPRGKDGIRIEGSKIIPAQAELDRLVLQYGPAAKLGERAAITAVRFEHGGIYFEINGGPVKHKSWHDRISVDAGGVRPRTTPDQSLDEVNGNGSFVFLAIQDHVASLTPAYVKEQLSPVLDFNTMTVAEAYQKSLPHLLAKAIKDHHVLVGMDKQMVDAAVGRPQHRLRETRDGKDYEEWIYGAPPQDIEFIRFLGDKVVSIEDMKVSGEKQVRTQDEIGALGGALDASAPAQSRPGSLAETSEQRGSAPTLLRPGEKSPNPKDASRNPNPAPLPDPSAPPSNGPN